MTERINVGELVDVTLVLSCGTSECPSHGSHDPNVGGSMACMAMVGWCSSWTKPNIQHEPAREKGLHS